MKIQFAEKLLPVTIAGLGLAAAFGTQRYLEGYLQFWPSVLAAGSIECAYVALALLNPSSMIREQVMTTARTLVYASIAFNFGHAYHTAVPGGLATETARFEWLAFLQALGIASFVPWIALRLAYVQAGLSAQHEEEQASEDTLRAELGQAMDGRAVAVREAADLRGKVSGLRSDVASLEGELARRPLSTVPVTTLREDEPVVGVLPPPPHVRRPLSPPVMAPAARPVSLDAYPSLTVLDDDDRADAGEQTRIGPAPVADPTVKLRERH